MAKPKVKFFPESKDHLLPEQRSANMSKIRQQDTSPELRFRSALHKRGLRFRKNVKSLPGTPDIVLPKYRTVIFLHGCFWHRHDCKKGRSIPTSRKNSWLEKFNKNIARDRKAQEDIRLLGWNVIVVWECELKQIDRKADEIYSLLASKTIS
ncbi:MAG: DNA mismatch endonuclease Vsr [Saprospiraceae bacterium]|nr:DNA mismatch endonuclease Vsr [Saprospiraceae bacterium]